METQGLTTIFENISTNATSGWISGAYAQGALIGIKCDTLTTITVCIRMRFGQYPDSNVCIKELTQEDFLQDTLGDNSYGVLFNMDIITAGMDYQVQVADMTGIGSLNCNIKGQS